ncbi:MAG TPA: hypothetical protein PKI62_09700 [bacterium]|nr:hypothetical protein [bacterium]HPR87739.1 hypothetical protein [bacterium]
MNLLLRLAALPLPAIVRKKELEQLAALTAAAFGVAAPEFSGLGAAEALACYARFTRESAMDALAQRRGLPALEARLGEAARAYGARWRRRFSVTTPAEAMQAARVLYRAIGIDFRGTAEGMIEISSCYFSRFYAPEICRMISALDAGVLAGLAGGGTLAFSQRITEGHPCCRAYLEMR